MGTDSWRPGSAIQKGLTLRFSIGYRVRHFRLAVEMLAAGRIQAAPMISRTLGFAEFSAAFESLKRPGAECKLILQPAGA